MESPSWLPSGITEDNPEYIALLAVVKGLTEKRAVVDSIRLSLNAIEGLVNYNPSLAGLYFDETNRLLSILGDHKSVEVPIGSATIAEDLARRVVTSFGESVVQRLENYNHPIK